MKKGIDTERKKKSSNNKLNRAGEQWQKKVQKQYIKKKKLLFVSFDFLFSDSPYDLFCWENFNAKKSIQSWNQKVSWMPFAVMLI